MDEKGNDEQPRHPIQVAVRRTGLSPELIRVWERRYGAVTPARTSTRRRLYSNLEIERLRLLRRATLAGRPIRDVAGMETDALRHAVEADELAMSAAPPSAARPAPASAAAPTAGRARRTESPFLTTCRRAVEQADSDALRQALRAAQRELSPSELPEALILPLMSEIGSRWEHGTLGVAHEHLATAVVRSFLQALVDSHDRLVPGPVVVIACPQGHHHDLGALLAASIVADEGWSALYLGADMPAEDLAAVAAERQARAVVLSLVHPEADPATESEIRRLAGRLSPGIALLAGGGAAGGYAKALNEAGARQVTDLADLRSELRRLRDPD